MQNSSTPQIKANQPINPMGYQLGRGALWLSTKLIRIPGVNRILKNTFLGACSYTSLLSKKGQSKKAIQHLIKLLKRKKFKKKATFRWWFLMRQAITLAQDYQLQGQDLLQQEVADMMALAQHAPDPKQGYDAAYSFVGLGLWAFQMGLREQALSYVQLAVEADQEWGYPEYLMGWLALFEKNIDPIPHFVNALRFNWSFFHRINKDPVCQQHPEIIRKVRQQVLLNQENHP